MSSTPAFSEAAERHATSRTSDGSVLANLMRAAQAAGIDAAAELYNEALLLAKEGHYGQARDRLHVLLGLHPSDGDAHLLLAKVHVAGQQWRRALAALDEAAQCGARVPGDLREKVLRNLQAEGLDDEDETARLLREQGELKKLRGDVRRIRSENAHLAATNRNLQKEAARWGWVATSTSLVAIVVMVGRMFLAGGEAPAPAVAPPAAAAAAPIEAATPAAAGVAPDAAADVPSARNGSAADALTAALTDAGFTDVSVVVRGGRASLAGTVPDHATLKALAAAADAVEGIDEVVTDGVENVARRKGTTHVVQPGESLSVIAFRMYGDQSLASVILAGNPKLGGKPNLNVGMELAIPPVK